jgi:hypothetical protein
VTSTPTGDRELLYLFSTGGESGAVYWCLYDWADQTGYPLSFWTRIDGLTGKIATVVGADSYQIFTKRYLYLFLIVESEGTRELAFTRFDLRTRTWSPEITPLKPPRDIGTFSAALIERLDEKDLPTLAIRASDGTFYQRFLNQTGLDWADGEWVPRDRVWRPWQSSTPANTNNPGTRTNASALAPGSRFFGSHTTDSNVLYLACLGQDGQVYGFRLNGYFLIPRLESFNVPKFFGLLSGAGGVSGIARNALLPNSQTVMPQIDLFVVGNDQSIQTAHWDLFNGWGANQWSRMGNPTDQALADSIVAVTARHPNILDVFIIGTDDSIYEHSWGRDTGYVPTGWTHVFQPPISAPFLDLTISGVAASAPSGRQIDLLFNLQASNAGSILGSALDFDGLAHYRWTDTNGWGWGVPNLIPESKDVVPSALLTSIVRNRNSFDVFVPRGTGGIWTARSVNAVWSKWEQVGDRSTNFTGTTLVTTLARSSNHLAAFAIDEHAIHSSWQRDGLNGDKWYPWGTGEFSADGHLQTGKLRRSGDVASPSTLRPYHRSPLCN